MMKNDDALKRAITAISRSEALLIGAGAGMGVDSGLPDFRGERGFWRAYPLYEKLGLNFQAMANPRWFQQDPTFAWGFYGHRLDLYRRTQPHQGFALLLALAGRMRHGAFVFTSNVDGQFQRAGFPEDRVAEVHGSIHHMQCTRECGVGILPADPYSVTVDPDTLRATGALPACPSCHGLLRPNILMFGDATWDDSRSLAQERRLDEWLHQIAGARLCIIECGAGTAIPSVRHFCEHALSSHRATLLRINPREPQVDARGGDAIGLQMSALDGLRSLCQGLGT